MNIEAMKLALEALDIACRKYGEVGSANTDWGRWDSAMTALRAAIEQAEQNQFNPDWNRVEALQECLREYMTEIQRLRGLLEQAEKQEIEPDKDWVENDGCPTEKAVLQRFWREHQQAERQEPVAWIYSHRGQKSVSMNFVAGVRAGPLYLSPLQAWGTVSDAQLIDEVKKRGFLIRDAKIGGKWVGLGSDDFNDFNPYFKAEEAARWAECKLKEKNNG